MTNEQIEQILEGAPDGATHVEHTGLYSTSYLFMARGTGSHKTWKHERWVSSDNRRMEQCWPICCLSDLREILALRLEVDRLNSEVEGALSTGYFDGYSDCGDSFGGLDERRCYLLSEKCYEYAEKKIKEQDDEL